MEYDCEDVPYVFRLGLDIFPLFIWSPSAEPSHTELCNLHQVSTVISHIIVIARPCQPNREQTKSVE